MIASLGLASLLGIIAVATSHCVIAPAKYDAVSVPSAKFAAVAGSPRPFRYIRSGQWQADARTFAAAIRYLLEPENQAQSTGGFPPLQLAKPTNVVSATALMRGTS